MPVQGSGLSGGMKRRAPEVDAPYGRPLKTYTPLRSYPRTLPELVSTVVAVSEAMTLPRPHETTEDCGEDAREDLNIDFKLVDAHAVAANSDPSTTIPPIKARLWLEKDVDLSVVEVVCDCFSGSVTDSSLVR